MKRIITARNEKNTMFLFKKIRLNWFFSLFNSSKEEIKSEAYIIDKIKKGKKFYIANGDKFTEVDVFGDHIRSKPNKTKKDNISNLPIRII